jgi:hypothetical protein
MKTSKNNGIDGVTPHLRKKETRPEERLLLMNEDMVEAKIAEEVKNSIRVISIN